MPCESCCFARSVLKRPAIINPLGRLGGLYVGFILQAMAADFYPRLTASAHDNPMCNRLVNEQTQVGFFLAGPGVLATLTFTPIVIGLFYSAKFLAAVAVLRWICLGTTLQVITWPMGFIIVAKGKQALFFAHGTELGRSPVSASHGSASNLLG